MIYDGSLLFEELLDVELLLVLVLLELSELPPPHALSINALKTASDNILNFIKILIQKYIINKVIV